MRSAPNKPIHKAGAAEKVVSAALVADSFCCPQLSRAFVCVMDTNIDFFMENSLNVYSFLFDIRSFSGYNTKWYQNALVIN